MSLTISASEIIWTLTSLLLFSLALLAIRRYGLQLNAQQKYMSHRKDLLFAILHSIAVAAPLGLAAGVNILLGVYAMTTVQANQWNIYTVALIVMQSAGAIGLAIATFLRQRYRGW